MVDGLALDLVDDLVERGLVADADRVAAQRLPVDDQRDLGDVGVRRRSCACSLESSTIGVGPVVQEALEPAELALGVVANPVRDLDILALDDRPHAHLRVRQSIRGVGVIAPGPRRRITLARDRDGRDGQGPGALERHGAGGQRRAGRDDVVDEQDPAPDAGRRPRGPERGRRTRRRRWPPARRGRGRTGRSSPAPASSERGVRQPAGAAAATRAISAAWS